MTESEKKVSFLNRYFIFKKVRNVDTSKINKLLVQTTQIIDDDTKHDKPEPIIKPKAKKISKKKIKIDS